VWARGIAACLLAASLASAQSWKLPLKNEESRDPGLVAFLKNLRDTARKNDVAALLRAISPQIKNGFGGDDGEAAFRRAWELDKGNSPVFAVLTNILSLGGAWIDDQYCAPYLVAGFPPEIDAFSHHVVVGQGVRLRSAALPDAPVVARLSYDIVETLERTADWSRVKTHDGITGFISTAYLYSPIGYRACFMKDAAGNWHMVSLVAGD
jgi:hypothetical protein